MRVENNGRTKYRAHFLFLILPRASINPVYCSPLARQNYKKYDVLGKYYILGGSTTTAVSRDVPRL